MRASRFISLIAVFIIVGCIFCVTSSGITETVTSPQHFVLNGQIVKLYALNSNNCNYVKIDELSKLLDIGVTYNEETKAYSFDRAEKYSGIKTIGSTNPYYIITDNFSPFNNPDTSEINGSFAVEYKKTDSGTAIVDCAGDYNAVLINLGDGYIDVKILRNINDRTGICGELYKLADTINGQVNCETNENDKIAELYRVYISGTQVIGKLMIIDANGDYSYRLSFEEPYLTQNGDIIRIEFGRKPDVNIAAVSQNISVGGMIVCADAINIGGNTYVKIAELAKLLDIDISFNELNGAVALDTSKSFDGVRIINAENPYYLVKDGEQLYDHILGDFYNGFALEFIKTEEGLAVVDCTGDYRVIDIGFYPVENYTPYVLVQTFQNTTDYSGIFHALDDLMPYNGGVSYSADTDTARHEIAKIFRVYINGKQVFGNLSSHQGCGNITYQLSFDTPLLQNIGDSLRIELGRN